jgi:hypothetical protein
MNTSEFMIMLDNQLTELLNKYPSELRTKERAFIAWVLLNMSDLDISENDALEAIVDGNQEKGIDAIYVPDSGGKIVILQGIYHKDPKGKGIKKNELVKLFAGVDWLLDGDLEKIDRNPRFTARSEAFRDAYYNFDYSSVAIVFAATVTNGCGKEENDEIDKVMARFQERGAPFIVDTLTVKELTNALVSKIHRRYNIDIDLKFIGKPLPYEREKADARAIVGTVNGGELVNIYKKHNFRIFDINIRNFLGNVKINQGITRTATDINDAKYFWFYNNGVTFVCDEYSFRSLEDTVVRIKNAQIINGCQTVTSLHHAGKEMSDDVEVFVRIIERQADINFVRRVTLFANSQNAVRPTDLVGTDTLQLELKRMLLDFGYYYETRRGDYKAEKDSLPKPVNDVINLKEAAQAYATVFGQKPGIAKKDTSKLFQTRQDGGFYEEIFAPDIMPEQIIAAVTLMKNIPKVRLRLESKLSEEGSNIPGWLLHSDFFMAGLFSFATFHDNKKRDKDYLQKYTEWIKKIGDPEIDGLYGDMVTEVDTVVRDNEKTYGYSHPKFFKTQIEYAKKLKPIIKKHVKKL